MEKRFVSVWFSHLTTDWYAVRNPALQAKPFVVVAPEHGRPVIRCTNGVAHTQGITTGMVLADARALVPGLEIVDEKPELSRKLLRSFAKWFIRFTPVVSVDEPEGLMLDVTGCAHLWGGEKVYLSAMIDRLINFGYQSRAAIASTPATAWAMARFGKNSLIVRNGSEIDALLSLPPAALRLDSILLERLQKLGLYQIGDFISMPRQSLRRRFGTEFIIRLDQAIGKEEEPILPLMTPEPFVERLPCLEPIVTLTGIEVALQELLEILCARLVKEGKGIREVSLQCYRVDNKIEKVFISTSRPSTNTKHLRKLFDHKISAIEPALGIELFCLVAGKVEDLCPLQEKLWETATGLENNSLSELLDRLSNRIGMERIHRYLPDEHHWPERSVKPSASLEEKPSIPWKEERPRPMQLLKNPELIRVTAPVPDYPPMNFRHRQNLHVIRKADGPERIEREWWIEEGPHRDYYFVEDEEGRRYWIFRSGHYDSDQPYQWFLHGIFA